MTRALLRQAAAGLRLLLVLTAVTGLLYPLAVWGVGRLAFPHQAGGSRVASGGEVVGSELLGQAFAGPRWFHPRPSAAGAGYDPRASGGSDLGPESDRLLAEVRRRVREVAEREGVPPERVPADAVTASGSGLDPDISPAYARLQVDRVAAARGLPAARVRELVDAHRDGRQLGFLGQPRVNVLALNLALDRLAATEG